MEMFHQPLGEDIGVTLGVITGGVASRWMVRVLEDEPPALVAEHVKEIPLVSATTVWDPHPMVVRVGRDSGSATIQSRFTSLVYQLLSPRLPVMDGVMTGAVMSIVQFQEAGVPLFPAASTAYTEKVCGPAARPLKVNGLVHNP